MNTSAEHSGGSEQARIEETQTTSRTGWKRIAGLMIGAAVSLAALWLADFPLGIPGEWAWRRIVAGRDGAASPLYGLIFGAVFGGLYVGFAWIGCRRIANSPRLASAAWVTGLTVVGFLLSAVLQTVPSDGFRDAKSMWVLYFSGASGYFDDTVKSEQDDAEFLAGYESKMAEGDSFHIGTHPPGLFLANRVLLNVCRESSATTSAVLATQSRVLDETFRTLETEARVLPKLTDAERAALWLSVLLTHLVATATIVPLYLLVRRSHGRRAAWMAATFWPLVPAVAVFLPKSDALFPFLGMAFLWLWSEALARRSCLFAAAAGLTFWCGLQFSLALLPVGLLAVLLTLWETRFPQDDGTTRRTVIGRHALLAGCAAVAFLVATYGMWREYDVNLFNVWSWNLRNHAGFYAGNPRTWWKWLLVNPLELLLAVGWPIVFFAVLGGRGGCTRPSAIGRTSLVGKAHPTQLGPAACCLAVWLLLWISGKNMGEAARLWLFLMPWFLWMSASVWDTQTKDPQSAPRPAIPTLWLIGLITQLVVCLLTVARVSGFHFGSATG